MFSCMNNGSPDVADGFRSDAVLASDVRALGVGFPAPSVPDLWP